MNTFFRKIRHFWDEDTSLTISLVLLLVFIFVLVPVLDDTRPASQFIIRVIYTLILVTCVLSVSKKRGITVVITFFGLLVFLAGLLSDYMNNNFFRIVNDSGVIIFYIIFASAVLFKTFAPGEINVHRVQGSVLSYIVFGLAFANTYHLIYLLYGNTSFTNIDDTDIKHFYYYSFTTLTTMGYGDIVPVHPFARSLANLEGLIGQLYPAILIARLVSLETGSKSARK